MITGATEGVPLGLDLLAADRPVVGFGDNDEIVRVVPLDLAPHGRHDIGDSPEGPLRGRAASAISRGRAMEYF